MNADKRAARELFLKYAGSHFFIEREGEYERYRAFGISRQQEIAWVKERQQELFTALKNEPFAGDVYNELFTLVSSSRNAEDLGRLVEEIAHIAPEAIRLRL